MLLLDTKTKRVFYVLGDIDLPDGTVVGPETSIDNGIVTFDGTTGELIKSFTNITLIGDTLTQTANPGDIRIEAPNGQVKLGHDADYPQQFGCAVNTGEVAFAISTDSSNSAIVALRQGGSVRGVCGWHQFSSTMRMLAGDSFSGDDGIHMSTDGSFGLGGKNTDAAVAMNLKRSNRGFLPNRGTTAERTAISNPPDGLEYTDLDRDEKMIAWGGQWFTVGHTDPVINNAALLPPVVDGFHVWPDGTYRIKGSISSQYGHKRADGAKVYIYGKNLEDDVLEFTGGVDGTFTAASDNGSGGTTLTTASTTGFADGDVIFLPQSSVYSQEQRYTISNLVADTSFDIDVAFVGTDSGIFYKGAMFTDDETATGQDTALIRLENVGARMPNGGRLLDIQDGGNTRGTFWFKGGFLVGSATAFAELGTLHNCLFATFSDISICTLWDDGLHHNDINQFIINNQMTGWKDNGGIMFKGGDGTYNIFTVSGAGSIVQPQATESAYYFDPGATYLQPVVIDGIVNTGNFFATGSLDQESIYLECAAVGGVPDSETSAQVDVGANAQVTSVPATGANVLINSNQWASEEMERMSVDSNGVSTYLGLRGQRLKVGFSTTVQPSSGTNKTLKTQVVRISSTAVTVTFDNTTNTVNETGTALSNGDQVFFYDTTGTLPAELRTDVVYYVVGQATNSFQLAYTLGGTAIAFTDDGTPTNSYKAATLESIPAEGEADAGAPESISRFGKVKVLPGEKIAIVARNETDAIDIEVVSGGYVV